MLALTVPLLLSCAPVTAERTDQVAAISVSFDLVGAQSDELTVGPLDRLHVDVTFTNVSASPTALKLLDGRHPDSRAPLPYPHGVSVRYEHADGRLHRFAEINGQWMTQYLAWSDWWPDWPLSAYELEPQGSRTIRIALADVLRVPAGGSPADWIIGSDGRIRPGRYTFQVRYFHPELNGKRDAAFDKLSHYSGAYRLTVLPSSARALNASD